MDEEGLQAYSGHLQQEFLRPESGPVKKSRESADAENSSDSDEEEDDAGPAPEDAARR